MKRIVHKNRKRPAEKNKEIVELPRRLGDEDISIADLRTRLGDLVSRVSYKHDRVVITKHGKPVAALISASDMEKFQELEDLNGVQAAKAAERETKKNGTVPLEVVVQRLGLDDERKGIHRRVK
jgi:prevent-host-death family protein